MIVMKFGGSSVATGKNIASLPEIISSYSDKKIVVVISALEGVTDSLAGITGVAKKGDLISIRHFMKELLNRHQDVIQEAVMDKEIKKEVRKIILNKIQELENTLVGVAYIKEVTKRSMDRILSFGEQLSAPIVCGSLQSKGIKCIWLTGGQLPTSEVHGLAPSQDWFMHSLQSRCIGAIMQEPVDRDSSGVNLEPFLVRNSVPQHQSFDSYSQTGLPVGLTTWSHSLYLNRE
ncbi:MAG: hypothetical protein QXG05_05090 [Nitrososphaerota archaeon]